MQKKAVLTTLVALLLLIAAIIAGVNAVFTVTLVSVEFETCSAEGREEAERIEQELNEKYVGKSSSLLDLEEVRACVEAHPCFRVVNAEKSYPTTVKLSVEERRETFAFASEGGYSIIDETGRYLYVKERNENRAGGANILLEGFDLSGEGDVRGDYFAELLKVASAFRETLPEIRANVVSVRLVRTTSDARNDFFRIRMVEGVVIDLGNPSFKPAEKAALALKRYDSLSDEHRSFGFITVVDSAQSGEVLEPDYSRESAFVAE